MSATPERREEEVDLQEVSRLVEALGRDLETIPGGSPEIQRLKDEVETLKNVLQSPIRRHHWVRDALHGIREGIEPALDAALARGVKGGQYIAEIGRILGL